jgi:hypothetical protein
LYRELRETDRLKAADVMWHSDEQGHWHGA